MPVVEGVVAVVVVVVVVVVVGVSEQYCSTFAILMTAVA